MDDRELLPLAFSVTALIVVSFGLGFLVGYPPGGIEMDDRELLPLAFFVTALIVVSFGLGFLVGYP